ncbi:site-specific integrase [Streptomyces hygroscopicus]|uniref:hypothetical protein n=1 Tax=Streptomyces hygroscopicus TaxID=1912 RepID=UPI000A9B2DC0|nr:hypothetical protein [Streptomyces hygroscopicus]
MVQSIHAVLRNALEHAVREELIMRNVAKLVKTPAPSYRTGKGLSPAQAKLVLKELRDHRLHALYVLALLLGMQRGELLGLCWSAVDLERGTLTVLTNLQRVGGELRLVLLKTRSSERTIPPLPPLAVSRSVPTRSVRRRSGRRPAWPGRRTGWCSRPE